MLTSFTNESTNMTSKVQYVNLPFRTDMSHCYKVTLHDLDSDNYVGVSRHFATLDLAEAYARKLVFPNAGKISSPSFLPVIKS
jgi:hypothetical protein